MKCAGNREECYFGSGEDKSVFYEDIEKRILIKECPWCEQKLRHHSLSGYIGGSVSSEKKIRASRRNGKLGGRPRKKV